MIKPLQKKKRKKLLKFHLKRFLELQKKNIWSYNQNHKVSKLKDKDRLYSKYNRYNRYNSH